jgi:hypothetical protein
MAHTASCGNATTRSCRCGGCAGSQHGWTGALALAQPAMAGARAANHRSVERAWVDATKARSSQRPTQKRARAAVEAAKGDIEDWLAAALVDPPAATKQLVSTVGDIVATDVFDALCEALGPRNTNKMRAELAEKHLFCQLLAEIACLLQVWRDELSRATKRIAGVLLSYYVGRKNIKVSPFVADVVTGAAAKGIDSLVATMPLARHFDDMQRAVRILALMTCPAPEKHEAVVRCALKPLGQPIVSELVQERLKAAMPYWMA